MLNLITDRTQADVDRVAFIERRLKSGEYTLDEWIEYTNARMKGAYNWTDLNRVEAAVAEIAAKIGLELDIKEDWMWGAVLESDTIRFLQNIEALRNYGHLPTTPKTPTTMRYLTYQTANDIEQILIDVDCVVSASVFAGELFCGEV